MVTEWSFLLNCPFRLKSIPWWSVASKKHQNCTPLSINSCCIFSSSIGLVPRSPFATWEAHTKYSWTLSAVQPVNIDTRQHFYTNGKITHCKYTHAYANLLSNSFNISLVGVQRLRSRKLYNLSASLTSLAWWLRCGACTTCRRFLSSFGSDLSSVTSWTILATVVPNTDSSSSKVVSVSSTVSWSNAACITSAQFNHINAFAKLH